MTSLIKINKMIVSLMKINKIILIWLISQVKSIENQVKLIKTQTKVTEIVLRILNKVIW